MSVSVPRHLNVFVQTRRQYNVTTCLRHTEVGWCRLGANRLLNLSVLVGLSTAEMGRKLLKVIRNLKIIVGSTAESTMCP